MSNLDLFSYCIIGSVTFGVLIFAVIETLGWTSLIKNFFKGIDFKVKTNLPAVEKLPPAHSKPEPKLEVKLKPEAMGGETTSVAVPAINA